MGIRILIKAVAWSAVLMALSFAQPRITYNGVPYWINGINVPWNNFGTDVGGGGYNAVWFEAMFSACEQNGINAVRLWVHASGWATPEFDNNGFVTGLDNTFLLDLEDILRIGESHNVMVMPCLWSFDMTENNNQNGIGLIRDPAKTQSYINNALVPMVTRFANAPNLLAWEVSNEPEWSVESQAVVSWNELVRFGAMLAAAIHQNSSKMVTMGSASLKWNSDVPPAVGNLWSDASMQVQFNSSDAYLDFYQVHYYDWMVGQGWHYNPFEVSTNVSFWELDKPVLIGESPAATDGLYTIREQINNSFNNGYAGIMFWSYNSDWSENWNLLASELKIFREAHPSIIDYPGTASALAQRGNISNTLRRVLLLEEGRIRIPVSGDTRAMEIRDALGRIVWEMEIKSRDYGEAVKSPRLPGGFYFIKKYPH